jgi:TPR repeat protein
MAVLMTALAFVGCGGPGTTEQEPPEVPVSASGEEDAYQTAVYAQQRAEWEAQAQQGDSKAQRQLGMMYYLGQGMDVDYAMAHEWLSKAANQGDDVAQMTLGVMYAEGQGVPQSNVNALLWYSLSAQQGNSSAQARLEELTPGMTPDEIEQAEQLAENWQPS